MTGTVACTFGDFGGVIFGDGEFLDPFHPLWILQPAPRDGRYVFTGVSFAAGTRVSFTPNPGDILPGGTFTTESTATDVAAI